MKIVLTKIFSVLAAIFGVIILVAVVAFYQQGVYDSMSGWATALKLSSSVVRAGMLMMCAVAAWKFISKTPVFAWGAFAAFTIGGALDVMFQYGVVAAFSRLMPEYYIMSVIHAVYAIALWLLVFNTKSVGGNG
ncbi:hypothetical protein FT643_22580 [Ketobacter sp. MCCC 1A13808]|uniref:hypothetical protein n=1 Tax=Ketobacter sp. MCCC 1A13808 TaxID=2602738 RepID=UPI0012EBC646|nr:hypothetical protein [Ketobacter sp. MCCC 1A13808]MVF14924.1 hypothetical protein [Ketobacter sp. MCCC 1A13808]